ncbi:hypothetical protein [Pseudoduganella sp. R-34]|uniref:hypothetical protein n=1 Tax=Pseudoduganella sp. R-34 TaxID=3404062 RepID=UPI003CFA73C8
MTIKVATLLLLAVVLTACTDSSQKVEVGSKENFDKGVKVMAEQQRKYEESDKLLDADAKPKEKNESAPAK